MLTTFTRNKSFSSNPWNISEWSSLLFVPIYLTFKFPTENYSAILDNQYVIQEKYKARGNTWCNWIKYLKDTTSIFKTIFAATRNSSLQYWSVTDFRPLNKQCRLVVLLQKIWEPQLQWAVTTTEMSHLCSWPAFLWKKNIKCCLYPWHNVK